jgi:hypothetical protein
VYFNVSSFVVGITFPTEKTSLTKNVFKEITRNYVMVEYDLILSCKGCKHFKTAAPLRHTFLH